VENRFERLQVDITDVATLRESCESRIRSGQEEMRKITDSWQGTLHDELGALERQVTSIHEELSALQRRLSVELRAETRALLKSEQNAIAALDEQLWLTDQRLGQRIDELVQAAGRGERIAAVAVAAELATHSPARTPPTSEPHGSATAARAAESSKVLLEAAGEGSGPRNKNAIPRLSDAEQLERLRGARKRGTAGGLSLAGGGGAATPAPSEGASVSVGNGEVRSSAPPSAARSGGLSLLSATATRRAVGIAGRSPLTAAREAAEALDEAAHAGA